MSEDQIREKLARLHEIKGLPDFCRLAGVPYLRVWRFAAGKTKSLSLSDGSSVTKALKKPTVKAQLQAAKKTS